MPLIKLPNKRGYAIKYSLGRRNKKKYETLGQVSYTRAKAILHDRLNKVSAGKLNVVSPTLAQAAADYLGSHEWKSDGGQKRAESIIRLHIAPPPLGPIFLSNLKAAHVKRWRKARSEDHHVSDATLDREYNTLRAILNYAVASDIIETSPIKRGAIRRLVKSTDGRIVFFEPEEWRAFRSALDDENRWQRYVAENRVMGPVKIATHIDKSRRYGAGRKPESEATAEYRRRLLECRAIFDALLWTGCRLGEVLELRWEAVDLRNGFIHIGQIKTGNAKSIPIGAEFRAGLESLPRGVGRAYIYTRSTGQPFYELEIQRAFRVYREIVGLREELTPHAIRHTFASWLVIKGVPIRSVQELLGHKSLSMTLRYAHLAPRHLVSAVSALEAMKNSTAEPSASEEGRK